MNNPQQVNETNPQPVTNDAVLQEFITTKEFNESVKAAETVCIEMFNHLKSLSEQKWDELFAIKDDKSKLKQYAEKILSTTTKTSVNEKREALKVLASSYSIQENEIKTFLSTNFEQSLEIKISDRLGGLLDVDTNSCLTRHLIAREIVRLELIIGILTNLYNPIGLGEVLAKAIEGEAMATQEFLRCTGKGGYSILADLDLEIKSVTEEDDITDGNGEGNNNRPGWIIADVDNPIQL